MGQDHHRRLRHEGTAVCLRQDRPGRPGPRPLDLGWELVSSGGTSAALAEAGIDHLEVADLTGAPEMLGGRVKTLHPTIHGGILADRSQPAHLDDLDRQGIGLIDLVVCNLYPFTSDPSIELIDVGGPTMVRAAAKNHDHVGIVVAPGRLRRGAGRAAQRRVACRGHPPALARAAFAHTAAYDAAIVQWFDDLGAAGAAPRARPRLLPPTIHLTLERAGTLRYGENPHQQGARYRDRRPALLVGRRGPARGQGALLPQHLRRRCRLAAGPRAREAGGAEVAVAIIKHANPCGAALHADLPTAYRRALECDPTSAFGGIVALGGPVTVAVAEAIAAGPQADVIIAPSYDRGGPRPADLEAEGHPAAVGPVPRAGGPPAPEPRGQRAGPGADRFLVEPLEWEVATKVQPDRGPVA